MSKTTSNPRFFIHTPSGAVTGSRRTLGQAFASAMTSAAWLHLTRDGRWTIENYGPRFSVQPMVYLSDKGRWINDGDPIRVGFDSEEEARIHLRMD